MPEKVVVLGFPVYNGDLSEIELCDCNKKLLLTISPNSYGLATKDAGLRRALKEADYLVLDGVYFGLAGVLLCGKLIKKNQGPDVFNHFMRRLDRIKGTAFFLGSTDYVLKKIEGKIKKEFPFVMVSSYSPPFKNEFTEKEDNEIIDIINKFKPDILFIGMTCPKQEKWAFKNKNKIEAKLICCIGAVFDWYAGTEPNVPDIFWKIRLGWLIRTINRPEILKRYINIFIYFWDLFLSLFCIKKIKC